MTGLLKFPRLIAQYVNNNGRHVPASYSELFDAFLYVARQARKAVAGDIPLSSSAGYYNRCPVSFVDRYGGVGVVSVGLDKGLEGEMFEVLGLRGIGDGLIQLLGGCGGELEVGAKRSEGG